MIKFNYANMFKGGIYMTIGEVAKKLNIPVHTLRYYDSEGLLMFVERDSAGRRAFKETDVIMLNTILCLKSTGMSLKDIKRYVEWCAEGVSTLEERYNMFLEQKKLVENQIEELQKVLRTIDFKCDFYKNAIETGNPVMCESERVILAKKIINKEL